VQLMQPADAAAALGSDRLLALVGFGENRPVLPQALQDPRVGWVPLPVLESSEPAYEAWFGSAPVVTAVLDTMVISHGGEIAFGYLQINEAAAGGLEAATTAAYVRIFAGMKALDYPHLLRVWHVFSDINGTSGDIERYKVFCRGRHTALAPYIAELEVRLPAASAVGGRVPGLTIHFLACRSPGLQIENPRQVSAFRYPPEYGPRSPAFSRARLLPGANGGGMLLISGTASIVGHRTWHVDDVDAQFTETVSNIEAVLATASAELDRPLRLEAVRAYLRLPESAAHFRALLTRRLGGDVPAVVLGADICRDDLLLEIEGVAHAESA
jgi:chorismate lyase/3-hydroxybenzoate synthase